MKIKILTILALIIPLNLMAAALLPGQAENGKKLHDSHSCISCHSQMTVGNPDLLYIRADHRVTDIGGLIKQVSGCNTMQKVGLSESEVNDVVKYLNQSFYKFSD